MSDSEEVKTISDTSKPIMLLCVLGGVVSYEDYGSFRTSRLGKAYYDAAKDNDCDI